jgi:hypothetical protein
MAFAGGYKKAHPKAGKRVGVGVSTISASTPFTGNTATRLRGTSFPASVPKAQGKPFRG